MMEDDGGEKPDQEGLFNDIVNINARGGEAMGAIYIDRTVL